MGVVEILFLRWQLDSELISWE